MPEKEAKPSWMERYGMRYFAYLSQKGTPPTASDEIHVLNPQERRSLRRIQNGCIARQSIAGAVSAAISVLIGFLLWPRPGDWDAALPWDERFEYYAWLYSLSFFVTSIEIGYLYYDSLKSVHKLSTVAGLDLFPIRGEEQGVTVALVRAALELPNPPDGISGVNPRAEISKIRLYLTTLLYKLKATATNFLVKAVMRRVAGRSALRALMEFVAVPVFAFWNGLIAYWVVRQGRIRAMGPSAVQEFAELVFPDAEGCSEEARACAFQAIGAAIVRTVDLHPNLVALMQATERHLGDPGDIPLDDSEAFLLQLSDLERKGQVFVLKVLCLACILDGRVARREGSLLREAFSIAGLEEDLAGVHALRRAFTRGQAISRSQIDACLPARRSAQG